MNEIIPCSNSFSSIESVSNNIHEVLASIPVSKKVSKKKFEEYQEGLRDLLVSDWKEKCETKIFQGVESAKYGLFLKMLQKNTGISDEILADLEAVEMSPQNTTKLKTFSLKDSSSGGQHGIIVVFKRREVS